MKKSYLIADSGGTKTDWCFIDHSIKKNFFSTVSYHPNLMTEEWINSLKEFWKQYVHIENLEVHFYGSGCLREPNKMKVENVFKIWGFKNVKVESDILAASRACFGNKDGWIGILGTGSVLAEIANKKVSKIYGGLGSLIGDEGSGFYFGKLLVQKYLKNEFSSKTIIEIESNVEKEQLQLVDFGDVSTKDFLSSLSRIFSETKNQEIQQIHRENIFLFFDKYLPSTEINQTICFVGSYAQFTAEFIKEYLQKGNFSLGKIISKPIVSLTEYTLKDTL